MTHDDLNILEFPSDFPIKIIGEVTEQFEEKMLEIIRRHHPELEESAIRKNVSGQGTYLAMTVIVRAESKEALDALYAELSQHPDTKMVL